MVKPWQGTKGVDPWVNYPTPMVFYGQEPPTPSGESTTTECGVNYQLLAVIIEVAQWGTPSCSRPQPATDNGVIQLTGRTPHPHAVPPERLVHNINQCSSATAGIRTCNVATFRMRGKLATTLPMRPLRVCGMPAAR